MFFINKLKVIVGGEVFMFLTAAAKFSQFSSIFGQHLAGVAKDAPTEFPVILMGVRLVSEVWVLVIRGLVFIVFNCVDLVVFIESVVGGWLALLVS